MSSVIPELYSKLSLSSLPAYGYSLLKAAMYSSAGLAVLLVAAYLYLWVYREWALSYQNLSGPPPGHWFWGHMSEQLQDYPGIAVGAWTNLYGHTFRYKLVFGSNRISTADPVALNHIFTHDQKFPKPDILVKPLTEMLGNGLIFVEGDVHRRQRRILNHCFSTQSIRDVMPVFYDKAEELRDKLLGLIEADPQGIAAPTPATEKDVVEGGRKVDMLKFISMCTVDCIGLAGFDYDFKALSQPSNKLAEAFKSMFAADEEFTTMAILQTFVPGMSAIPTKRQRTRWAGRAITERMGQDLIEKKKRAVEQIHSDGLEKHDDIGKDILSSCIRANMAVDLKPEHKLSDVELIDQIMNFMLAGNETISTNITWIFYSLTQSPEIQARLREECLSVAEERPTLETIFALPYLNGVVHEGLRLWPSLQASLREAAEDSVLPLGTPVKGRDGKMMDHVRLAKGTQIFIPTCVVNTSEEIWGADAKSFNPLRHIAPADGGSADGSLRPAQDAVPGHYGHILTFIGGPRNCIGYRFAIAEIKIILFVLMRALVFEELASKPKIEQKSFILTRPRVVGEESAGLQMPLMVKALSQN